MKKVVIIICIVLLFSACKKDCPSPCEKNIENDITLDTHYNKINGCLVNDDSIYELVFQDFQDFQCYPSGIPVEIGFNGIVIVSGYQVPYAGSHAYEKSIILKKDSCDKVIDFTFILETKDTSDLLENNENVIVLLNGVDASYTVNFSHEIIPFGE